VSCAAHTHPEPHTCICTHEHLQYCIHIMHMHTLARLTHIPLGILAILPSRQHTARSTMSRSSYCSLQQINSIAISLPPPIRALSLVSTPSHSYFLHASSPAFRLLLVTTPSLVVDNSRRPKTPHVTCTQCNLCHP
jgi:hypothetical protein